MAYRRRTATRARRPSTNRRSYGRARPARASGRVRRSSGRSKQQVVRLVIEQAAPSNLSGPATKEVKPKQARF